MLPQPQNCYNKDMYPDDYLNKDDNEAVYFFCSPFEPLNNWSAHAVKIWGKTFHTLEHAYHYKKFDDNNPEVAKMILESPSPWAAMKIATDNKHLRQTDWENIKRTVMKELLQAKLAQNEDVRLLLKKTGSRRIVENSPWDNYWGCGADSQGQNVMGQLWMELRSGQN